PANAEQHDTQSENGERLPKSGEAAHVDEEHLEYTQDDDSRRSDPYRLSAQKVTETKQQYPEGEPHRRICVLLGVSCCSLRQNLAVIERPHLKREVSDRQPDRHDRRDDAVHLRPLPTRNQRQYDRERSRNRIAEQNEIEEHAANGARPQNRIADEPQTEH